MTYKVIPFPGAVPNYTSFKYTFKWEEASISLGFLYYIKNI